MYKLPEIDLSKTDSDSLKALQQTVDDAGSYAAQVSKAKESFAAKPSGLFTKIRKELSTMAGDLVRCAYCEDSCADEIEHVRPKDFFPDQTFVWENYVFSCGPCNSGKRNQYPVNVAGNVLELHQHRKTHGFVRPPSGLCLFIDPRKEDPLQFLWLDILAGTFMILPLDEDDAEISSRADSTISILRLNREMLRKARENAYGGYRDRLAQLARRIDEGAPDEEIASRKADITRSPHRTVWLEMKRQNALIPDIKKLFAKVPVALDL